jgi:hypothetical protein
VPLISNNKVKIDLTVAFHIQQPKGLLGPHECIIQHSGHLLVESFLEFGRRTYIMAGTGQFFRYQDQKGTYTYTCLKS